LACTCESLTSDEWKNECKNDYGGDDYGGDDCSESCPHEPTTCDEVAEMAHGCASSCSDELKGAKWMELACTCESLTSDEWKNECKGKNDHADDAKAPAAPANHDHGPCDAVCTAGNCMEKCGQICGTDDHEGCGMCAMNNGCEACLECHHAQDQASKPTAFFIGDEEGSCLSAALEKFHADANPPGSTGEDGISGKGAITKVSPASSVQSGFVSLLVVAVAMVFVR